MNTKKPVAIIGSGISGLCSAIFLSKLYSRKVNLYTDSTLGKSSSLMAQSGFRAGLGINGKIIFTQELEKNMEIYFEKWLINLLNYIPFAIESLDIDLNHMNISNNYLDTLRGLPMHSYHNKNVGTELVKYLVKLVKLESNIKVFENHIIHLKHFENKSSYRNIKRYSFFSESKNGIEDRLENDQIILAIGGNVGSKLYGFSSNMEYKNYDIHNQIFNDIDKMRVQFHPFGIKKKNNKSPFICLPEIFTKNGYIITENKLNKISLKDFSSRKACVSWMNKFKEKIYFYPSKENKKLLEKKYQKYFQRKSIIGDVIEVMPVAHYLLSACDANLENVIKVGECKTNGFKLDRPAGMGITQSLVTAYDAAFQISKKI